MRQTKLFAALLLTFAAAVFGHMSALYAAADTGAVISVPASVVQGESFELTISFSADTPIAMVETDLIYNDQKAAFTGGSAQGSGGILHVKEFSDTQVTAMTVSLSFTAISAGDAEFSLSNCTVSAEDGTPLGSPSASAALSVNADSLTDDIQSDPSEQNEVSVPDKDENGIPLKGVLKSITVSEGELMPQFSQLIFDYTVKVGHEVEVFEVDAVTASESDYIWFEGSKKLSETGTVRTITVTDDEGNKNVYRIVVQRAPAPESSTEGSSSEAEPSSSEQESDNADAAAVIAEQTDPADDNGAEDDEVSSALSDSEPNSGKDLSSGSTSGIKELRNKLMPWLLVILLVLIAALYIIIKWLKNKSERRRRKIKTTVGRKSK